VVEAVRRQAGQIVHAQQNIFHASAPLAQLVERLAGGVMPPHLQQFFFCNSGSEAVDNAVKVARAATGRTNIISFDGGFHGRTIGAMSLTTSKTIYRWGPGGAGLGAGFAGGSGRQPGDRRWAGWGAASPAAGLMGAGAVEPAAQEGIRALGSCRGPLPAGVPAGCLQGTSGGGGLHRCSPGSPRRCHRQPGAAQAIGLGATRPPAPTPPHPTHPRRQGFQPLMPGTFTAPYPYCLHCKVQQQGGYEGYPLPPDCPPFSHPSARSCCMAPAEALEWMLKQQTAPQETAAIIIEPVLGERGPPEPSTVSRAFVWRSRLHPGHLTAPHA
jgi:hypothetical protein